MQSTNSLRFAGDVNIKEIQVVSLNGQSVNVINQVVSIEIYEDMFSSFISMSIVLKESVDYLNIFPFVGEEYVDVNVDTPSMNVPIRGRFYIYKITDRIYTSEKEVAYTLKCISSEFLNDANIKLTKSYGGNVSELAYKIYKEDGLNTRKTLIVDNSTNTTKFVALHWSPVKCLNYLASTAVSSQKFPSFLSYENRKGFNFRDINGLLTQSAYCKFTKDNYSRDFARGGNSLDSIANPQEDYKRIIELTVPIVTDYLKNITSGQLKSRLISHDIVTKKYKVKDYNVKKDPDSFNLLNSNPMYSKYAIANAAATMMYMSKHFRMFDGYSDVTNEKTMQKRLSFFENLQKFKVNITVLGRTDYTIGQVVELSIPKVAQLTREDTDAQDKMMSGKYLVTAISHYIDRESHRCNMELVKNSTILNLSTL
jgi:hypothetical protein